MGKKVILRTCYRMVLVLKLQVVIVDAGIRIHMGGDGGFNISAFQSC